MLFSDKHALIPAREVHFWTRSVLTKGPQNSIYQKRDQKTEQTPRPDQRASNRFHNFLGGVTHISFISLFINPRVIGLLQYESKYLRSYLLILFFCFQFLFKINKSYVLIDYKGYTQEI